MTASIIKTYTSLDGQQVELIYHDETLWLTQSQIAELFDVQSQTVSQHLHHIYTERELLRSESSRSFMYFHTQGGRTTQRQSKFYNEDAAVSVGYRINAHKATHFRIWVSKRIKELIKLEASAPKAIEAPAKAEKTPKNQTVEATAIEVE
ncbi:MAG: RhuM family protein [Pseudomonadota bacterium]|nr:RhuM family protein [Pseudomonadota bacterium]